LHAGSCEETSCQSDALDQHAGSGFDNGEGSATRHVTAAGRNI
jgi:hypothetical protein